MDVLSDVMQAVRLTGAIFFDVRFCAPITSQTPPMSQVGRQVMPDAAHVIPFHIVLEGRCWVESIGSGDPPVKLREGDIVLYPHGHAHALVTNLGDRLPPDLSAYRRPESGRLPFVADFTDDRPPDLHMACGYLGCDAAPFNPLLEALPHQVIARRPPEGEHMEIHLIRAAIAESGAPRDGSEAILARLSELLFVRVLRRHIESLPERSEGWLAGLRDASVGRALSLIHARPAHDWSVEEIARECGMSRATFSDRFAARVGETPMRYLARWRMQLAARILLQTGAPVEAVAEQVGYRSEAAFNRAFKSIVGAPPGAWRRAQGAIGADHDGA
jgi:AraC-like DNA-binding protein